MKVYLDTSVPNAYFDDKNPARKETTIEFCTKLEQYQIFISDVVIEEIKAIGNEKLREKLPNIVKGFECLSSEGEEIKTLAEEYITRGIIPVKQGV
ncbi:MAG: hypothetical protein ACE5OR_04710 [bacterium]